MATLIGTYDYFLWTNDITWLTTIYPKYKSAMGFITGKIDSTGMLSVTGTNDWGRLTQGGHNTEANMLLYKVLTGASQIATWAGDSASSSTWSSQAATLKAAVNANNYAASVGYVLHPRDFHLITPLTRTVHSKTTTQILRSTPKTPTPWPSPSAPPSPNTSKVSLKS